MFFAACPPVYHLPGTWDDPDKIAKCMDTLVPHFNLTPEQGFILFFCLFLFSLIGWGLYLTVGSGKKDLVDAIDEHAKMHELGIAHGHGGNKEAYEISGKLNHDHSKS
tara:strand:- start:194 stop:517 length:324 start_codon:yes stop_codon:yes gene_type:complete